MKWNIPLALELIEKLGYRRDFVASRVGIKHLSLTRYLMNQGKPSRPVLILLGQILGCTVEELEKQPREKKNAG